MINLPSIRARQSSIYQNMGHYYSVFLRINPPWYMSRRTPIAIVPKILRLNFSMSSARIMASSVRFPHRAFQTT